MCVCVCVCVCACVCVCVCVGGGATVKGIEWIRFENAIATINASVCCSSKRYTGT